MSEGPDDYGPYVKRAVIAARECIEAEAKYTKIGEETLERAWNILSYAFRLPRIWTDTYNLLMVMIPKMEMAGHREHWREFLEQGAEVSKSTGDLAAHGELCLAIGYLELLSTNLKSADAWFQHSRQCFDQIGDSSGQGQALNRLAVVQLYQQGYLASKTLAQEALKILPADHKDRANSHYILGSSCSAGQDWLDGERHFRAALEIWQVADDQRRIAWAWSNLGQALGNQNIIDDAVDCYEKALEMFTHIHDPANRAIAEMNLAIISLQCKQYKLAITQLLPARKVFLDIGDELNLARVSLNLGLSYAALKKWEWAKNAYDQSIKLWERLGITASLCNALDCLGETLLATNESEQAIEVLERGLQLVESLRTHPIYNELKRDMDTHLLQAYEQRKRLN